MVDENFRSEPNGPVLGVVRLGAPVAVVSEQSPWIEAEIEGWVFIPSLQVTDRGGFDVVVSEPGGENLRREPSGDILARLDGGTLLEEVERIPGWVHVRRRGWIWAPSLERSGQVSPGSPQPAPGSGGTASGSAGTPPRDEEPMGGAPGESPPDPGSGFLTAGPGGAGVLSSPDGDTLALAAPQADLLVLAREGGWARVRVEGWVWAPALDDSAMSMAPLGTEIGPAQVSDSPELYRGRLVTWSLQFISLERAERIRTDFFEGEPFLLTRPSEGEGPFVYVAVPPDRLAEMEGLIALEQLTVTGRIRVGASALTGSPILDLVELSRARGARRGGGER